MYGMNWPSLALVAFLWTTNSIFAQESQLAIAKLENLVTVTEQSVPICDPAAVIERVRFRIAKCLYLWKCGSKTP